MVSSKLKSYVQGVGAVAAVLVPTAMVGCAVDGTGAPSGPTASVESKITFDKVNKIEANGEKVLVGLDKAGNEISRLSITVEGDLSTIVLAVREGERTSTLTRNVDSKSRQMHIDLDTAGGKFSWTGAPDSTTPTTELEQHGVVFQAYQRAWEDKLKDVRFAMHYNGPRSLDRKLNPGEVGYNDAAMYCSIAAAVGCGLAFWYLPGGAIACGVYGAVLCEAQYG